MSMFATPTSANGSYTDYLTDTDGKKVLARQRDGIHYSWPGSVFPARIILSALQTEYRLNVDQPIRGPARPRRRWSGIMHAEDLSAAERRP